MEEHTLFLLFPPARTWEAPASSNSYATDQNPATPGHGSTTKIAQNAGPTIHSLRQCEVVHLTLLDTVPLRWPD